MSDINIFEFIFDTGKYVSRMFKKDSLGTLRSERNMYTKYFGPHFGKDFPAYKQNQLDQLEYEQYRKMYAEIAHKKSNSELECVINNEREHKLKREMFMAELKRRNNGE